MDHEGLSYRWHGFDEGEIMFAEYWFYMVVPLIFVAIVLWVYRPSAKRRYKADGMIPFDAGKNNDKSP